eukprot:scaffold942_cov366-Prasinococcus_capsulatus_cf.AAC.9
MERNMQRPSPATGRTVKEEAEASVSLESAGSAAPLSTPAAQHKVVETTRREDSDGRRRPQESSLLFRLAGEATTGLCCGLARTRRPSCAMELLILAKLPTCCVAG